MKRVAGGMIVDVSVLVVAKACSIGSSRAIIPLELDPTICDEQKKGLETALFRTRLDLFSLALRD